MNLTDLPEPTTSGSQYSNEDRWRAVVEFAVLGNKSRVAEATGIPRTTIEYWTSRDWWQEWLEEARNQVSEEVLANNLRIATEAQQGILERMENGDVVRTEVIKREGGETDLVEIRQPVRARDLAVIGAIAQDKARVQMGQPTRITQSTDVLNSLAEQFRQLADENRIVSDQ